MTTAQFKVGDRVKALGIHVGTITYGPITSTFGTYVVYAVRREGEDTDRAYQVRDLELCAEFTVGDKVDHRSVGAGEVAFGPFEHINGPNHYLMKGERGTYALVSGDAMKPASPAVKVGDRVRVVRAVHASDTHGHVGTVVRVGLDRKFGEVAHPYSVALDNGDSVYVAELELVKAADLYEHNGVTYDLTAKYRDRDGDTWTFAHIEGDVRGGMNGEPPNRWSDTLNQIARHYGPLTRVTD
ncbi:MULTISPECIES: phiSA1p31-related protein [unclassified Streptomyces]|uniref:phiSA1p31-related protein n=1 Tax=unclassified Streptomyces TaxID=2593676 RepID=UPI00340001C8